MALCADLEGREVNKGEDVCILTADLLCCRAETNTVF